MYFYLITLLSKLIFVFIQKLGLGSGYTWPGQIALKLYPNILSNSQIKFKRGVILISGTNGKTTTSKILTHILTAEGLKVVTNKTGANLLNGVVSAVLLSTPLFGGKASDIAVFEVDEFALPVVLKYLSPTVLVLLNLSRDQLDRYGETDIISDRWVEAVRGLLSSTTLVYYSAQPEFEAVASVFPGRTQGFGEEDTALLPRTGLYGKFNTQNLNAALIACSFFGIDRKSALMSLDDFNVAYGRGEILKYNNRSFHIFLAKNPASFNNNLEMFIAEKSHIKNVLIVLNDNIPDGRDVSWIYDIQANLIKKAFQDASIFVSGTRCLDMAVRLKYAGADLLEGNVFRNLNGAIKRASSESASEDVLVLPNYSAMLEVRKVLTGKKIL